MKQDQICACGCGKKTNTTATGVDRTFIHGHNRRGVGQGWIEGGYRYLYVGGQKVALHRLIIEEQLGRTLDSNEVVHHVDGDPLNNELSNLVVLSRAEHQRLHQTGSKRTRWTRDEEERAAELAEAGLTLMQISKVLGRCHSGVSKHVRKRRNSHVSNQLVPDAAM